MSLSEFLSSPLAVADLVLAILVKPGEGTAYHRDRPSCGLALKLPGERSVYHFSDGRILSVRVDTPILIYLPQGSTYTVHSSCDEAVGKGGCYAINFHLTTPPPVEPFTMSVKNPSLYISAFADAERAWTAKRADYREAVFSALYRVIGLMRSDAESEYVGGQRMRQLLPAIERLKRDFAAPDAPSIPELSALCGVSEVWFRKCFRSAFGMSPLAYLESLRLERAKELLRSGLYSVSDVCSLSGFSDPAYFSRFFKSRVGIPPEQYRRGMR